jgi:methylmalonyl-CoA/ethylmalonyl-CoA epimerase
MFEAIDHVGVAVSDLERAAAQFETAFGMPLVHRETVESQGVEAALLDIGDGHVELLRPLSPETVVGRFLAKRGEGLHHVAYRVDDIDAVLASLTNAGVELIDTEARIGIRGSRVAFLHPRASGGVLTELVELPGKRHD